MLKIKKSDNMLIFAEKTSNIYEMHLKDHEELIKNSVTKTFKKVPMKLEKSRDQKYRKKYQFSR